MEEKIEYKPSAAEIAKAESSLTPEQAVGSKARYEIRKHKEVLESVGVTETQINEASALASDKAIQEYHELERQEPWNRTMRIIEEVKTRLSPDEQVLMEGLTRWEKDFVLQWKERVEIARTRLGQHVSMSQLVGDIIQKNDAPSSVLQYGQPLQDFPSFLLFSPKVRCLVDPEAQRQRDAAIKQDRRMPVMQPRKPFGENEPWNEVIRPTKEGIAKIFKAFGAQLPPSGEGTSANGKVLVPTQFDGVYLSLAPRGDTVWLAFDVPTLVRMIDARKQLESAETE